MSKYRPKVTWTSIRGRELLAMARAARPNPDAYRQVKRLIHELRMSNDRVNHFQRLFWTQSVSLYQRAKEACRLSHLRGQLIRAGEKKQQAAQEWHQAMEAFVTHE